MIDSKEMDEKLHIQLWKKLEIPLHNMVHEPAWGQLQVRLVRRFRHVIKRMGKRGNP